MAINKNGLPDDLNLNNSNTEMQLRAARGEEREAGRERDIKLMSPTL